MRIFNVFRGFSLRRVILRILQITLDAEAPFASFVEVVKFDIDTVPRHLDIAGDFVLYSTPQGYPLPDMEKVELLRWTDGVRANLPTVRLIIHFFDPRTKKVKVTALYRVSYF